MPANAAPTDSSLRGQVSPKEWRARVDCAAVYRLIALFGWDDLIFSHVSMRVPDAPGHFLINPYGWLFEEITASSLVKVDADGVIVAPTPYTINPGAFIVHSAIHAAREDVACAIHLHTAASVGVSSQQSGLLPLTQTALLVLKSLAYHEYEGAAIDPDERARLARDLGTKKTMLMRNHGALTVGVNAADAFLEMHFLQRACEQQIASLSAGHGGLRFPSQSAQDAVSALPAGKALVAHLAWPALLRKLDRQAPGYDN